MKTNGLSHVLSVCALVALPAQADEYCAIHPPKGATAAQLAELAGISNAVAREIALNHIQAKDEKTVQSARLAVYHGCLIWLLEVKVAGNPGLQEILLDADTGRVISVRRKSAR